MFIKTGDPQPIKEIIKVSDDVAYNVAEKIEEMKNEIEQSEKVKVEQDKQ